MKECIPGDYIPQNRVLLSGIVEEDQRHGFPAAQDWQASL